MFTFKPIFQMDDTTTRHSTHHLHKIARLAQKQYIEQAVLPPPFPVLTKRTVFGIEMLYCGWAKFAQEMAEPQRWVADYFGHQNRKLAIAMKLVFTRPRSTFWNLRRRSIIQNSADCMPFYDDHTADTESVAFLKENEISTIFKTDVDVYPLTLQQASFVGCSWDCVTHPIIWGTAHDLKTLRGLPSELAPRPIVDVSPVV